jgi:glutathione S-transferase
MPLTAGYRRTPVLQNGADIYCDTQNIVVAISELIETSSLLPKRQNAKILAFSDWVDGAVFDLAVRVILTSALDTAPPEFIQDRAGLYFGPNWTPEGLKAQLPAVIRQLAAHLDSIDQALADTGGYLTESLSYADVAIAYVAWFIRGRWDFGSELLLQFPRVERIEREIHEQSIDQYEELSAESTLLMALESESIAPRGVQAQIGSGLVEGMRVSIRPQAETSDPPTIGCLRYLDRVRVSIDHQDPQVGNVVVHFPVAGYQIQPSD